MSRACLQLKCIERIARPVGRVKVKEFEFYLNKLIKDLQKANPKINFVFESSFPETSWDATPFATVVVLIIFELVDNAISTINNMGEIKIEIALLETTGMFNIIVHDTGPGIPEEFKDTLFNEGVSSKGVGRGLGLSLVRQASKLLHGDISYEYDKGAVFRVVLFPFSS